MIKSLFFNSSIPRSGSEMLQVLLSQNPDIYASTTSPLLEYQYGAMMNRESMEALSQDPVIMDKAFTNMMKGMAESYYSAITDKPYIVDKSRGWIHYYEWVNKWNPEPKMICMIRDLRSILASMEKIYRANRDRKSVDNPAEIKNMTVAERVNYWLHTQPVGLALSRTLDTFQKGLNDKILFVKYEDLCNNTQKEMDKIYKYLGLESFKHDPNNLKKLVYEDDTKYGIYGNHKVKPKIKPVPAQDWSEIFDASASNIIKNKIPWYFEVFGY